MNERRAESLAREHRLRSGVDYAAVKRDGRAYRGRHCLVLALPRPDDVPTKIGFIASKRGVGGAVQRNRARRRLREIVRRRWPNMPRTGLWLAFVAFGSSVTARHPELVADVETVLAACGALPRQTRS